MLQVFIPAAGKGTRVQSTGIELAKPIRSIGSKPMITRVMDLYPSGTRFLIALGYQGEWVRQIAEISARYNAQEIEFVYTESWKSNNQGLTNTLIDCQPKLGDEFIFHAVDSMVDKKAIDSLAKNIGTTILMAKPQLKGTYRTIKSSKWEKIEFTGTDNLFAYTGVSKIIANSKFWDEIRKQSVTNCEGGETIGINPEQCKVIELKKEEWLDCGSFEGIQLAGKRYQSNDIVLERSDEAIWIIQNRMIKFHTSEKFITERVARAKSLLPYVPKVEHESPNIYSYKRVDGTTLSKAPKESFKDFLEFCYDFWFLNLQNIEILHAKEKYTEFYKVKTLDRLRNFMKLFPEYCVTTINGKKVLGIDAMLSKIDWDSLSEITVGRVHGDLHPDNIIYSELEKSFCFLDWRQNLAGEVSAEGDIYYDLAKINHGLIVDHEKISLNEFIVSISGKKGTFSLNMTEKKKIWKKEFDQFVIDKNFDVKKIDILTALIFLNIAPLHHNPYNQFLFLLAHDLLNNQLNAAAV
jgi:hypothetical protein